MLPDGLRYLDSWIDATPPIDRCFQLMETDDPSLFEVGSTTGATSARSRSSR